MTSKCRVLKGEAGCSLGRSAQKRKLLSSDICAVDSEGNMGGSKNRQQPHSSGDVERIVVSIDNVESMLFEEDEYDDDETEEIPLVVEAPYSEKGSDRWGKRKLMMEILRTLEEDPTAEVLIRNSAGRQKRLVEKAEEKRRQELNEAKKKEKKQWKMPAPAGNECLIHSLNDELLAFKILCRAVPTLAEQLSLELVCRRWKRLMVELVWPRQSSLFVPAIEPPQPTQRPTALKQRLSKRAGPKSREGRGTIAAKIQERTTAMWKGLFSRCGAALVELNVELGSVVSVALEGGGAGTATIPLIQQRLFAHFEGLPQLKYLRIVGGLCLVSKGAAGDLEAIASHLPRLRTLALEGVVTSVSTHFENFFTRFPELEALVFTAEVFTRHRPTPITVQSLPPTLKYLAMKFYPDSEVLEEEEEEEEGGSSTIAMTKSTHSWLSAAVRDCRQSLETLRILPWGEDVEYAGSLNPEFVAPVASSRTLLLISQFERLKALQLTLGERDGSVKALSSILSKLQPHLIAIANPTVRALELVEEHCGPTLRHLSLWGGGEEFKEENNMRTSERRNHYPKSRHTLQYPVLRSLKVERIPCDVAFFCYFYLACPALKYLYANNWSKHDILSALNEGDKWPELKVCASTLDTEELFRLSALLVQLEQKRKRRMYRMPKEARGERSFPERGKGRKKVEASKLIYHPLVPTYAPHLKKEEYEKWIAEQHQVDLKNIEVTERLPPNVDLTEALFGALSNKPHHFSTYSEW